MLCYSVNFVTRMLWQKIIFYIFIVFCLSPLASPPLALVLGLVLALIVGNPYPNVSGKPTRLLLQSSVVLLGFGMNLNAVYQAGKTGILLTIATIFGTLAAGFLIGKLLKVEDKTSNLIASGTAICGGSAIAAVAPAIDADGEQISVSMGTIFVLNSVALLVFPFVGHFFDLTQNQFGIWAAMAIHDTSSVVGAAQSYGAEALATATTIKLARALWIAPVVLLFSFLYRSDKTRIVIPWFIFLFLLATFIRTYMPPEFPSSLFDSLVLLAKAGLTITLFFIGASLSKDTLRKVGIKPLLQGVVLWILISVVSLWAVLNLL